MSVIRKQSIQHTLVNYIGVAIGLLSTMFIYPRATELYGLYQIVFGSSLLVTSFFLLGFNVLAIKFFPRFKNEANGHNGFLNLLIKGGLIGFVLFLIFFPLVRYILLDLLFGKNENRALFESHFYFIIPIVLLFILNNLFLKYISNFHKIVIPTILDQLLIKIVLPSLVLLYLAQLIDLRIFFLLVCINYIFVFIGLVFYTRSLNQLHLKANKTFIDKPLAIEMRSYAGYGILNAIGVQLAFRIDILMVAGLVSISSGGIYGIVNIIIDVITKPAKAIIAIANPIISDKWEANDTKAIEGIYKKSSIVLLISGLFIFMGIWLSVDDLFSLMPNSEQMRTGKYVIFFLGISKLFDLATSVNTQIIANSKKFKFNFYVLLLLAVLNIIFNLVLIPKYQMVGAALATLCSLGIFNFVKLIYIWVQSKMQPFSNKTILLLAISAICYIICVNLPVSFHPFLNIMIRSIILTLLYFLAVYYFNVSEDLNESIDSFFRKYLNR